MFRVGRIHRKAMSLAASTGLIVFRYPEYRFFWIAAALAIEWNIWAISETYTLGLKVGGLPLEEAVFFLVTNLMVAQGLILFIVMKKELQKVSEFKRALLS